MKIMNFPPLLLGTVSTNATPHHHSYPDVPVFIHIWCLRIRYNQLEVGSAEGGIEECLVVMVDGHGLAEEALVISTTLFLSWYADLYNAAEGAPTVTGERYAVAASWRLCRLQAAFAVGARAPSSTMENVRTEADTLVGNEIEVC
jgi:hypothetical protein